jgi:hypothetical protein
MKFNLVLIACAALVASVAAFPIGISSDKLGELLVPAISIGGWLAAANFINDLYGKHGHGHGHHGAIGLHGHGLALDGHLGLPALGLGAHGLDHHGHGGLVF